MKPSFFAAAWLTSMMRPGVVGPRSVMVTTALRLFLVLVTLTRVPKASVGWAAVIAFGLKRLPDAVLRPANLWPYHAAVPLIASPEAAAGAASFAGSAAAGVADWAPAWVARARPKAASASRNAFMNFLPDRSLVCVAVLRCKACAPACCTGIARFGCTALYRFDKPSSRFATLYGAVARPRGYAAVRLAARQVPLEPAWILGCSLGMPVTRMECRP